MAGQLLYDGQTTFSGGQDASKIPSRIQQDSYAAAVNITVAQGVPSTPWGYTKRIIKLPEGGVTNPISKVTVPYAELFEAGRYQAFIPYQIGTENFIVIVISGIIFLVETINFTAQIMTFTGDGLNENTPRLPWSTAGKFTVIFDYPNFPVILDGNTVRRADPAKFEVPIATLGTYNQNRLFIANAGDEFTAGDPAGNLATPEAPITFEEIEVPSSPFVGQIFELPTGIADGPITAMGFLEFVDTSTGIGPLFVATANSIFTFNTQTPRANWENGQFGTAFISTSGITGPRAFINVNSDLFFLSSDYQVRTASMSRNEQHKWSKVPISREVENWLFTNDQTLAPFAVLGYFQNKVMITTNPFRTEGEGQNRQTLLDVAHGGLVVLELDNQATLGKDTPPCWACLTTRIRPMDIATTNLGQRCFVMSKDEEFRNELYEITPDQTYDKSANDVRQIVSTIYTREFDFQTSMVIQGSQSSSGGPFENKALHSIDLGFRQVKGDFSVEVQYKPSHGTKFVSWGKFTNKAPFETCDIPQNCFVNGFAPHEYRDLTIGFPLDNQTCDEVGKFKYNIGKKFQLKFIITGIYWQLQEFRLKANSMDQSQQVTACQVYSDAPVCAECNSDWATAPFKTCPKPSIIDPCAPIDSGVRICPSNCG